MKRNSTLENLYQNSQIEKKKSEKELEDNNSVKESVIQMLVAYSRSVRNIKTSSIGDVLIVNN